MDFVDDYFNNPVQAVKTLPLSFKIHLAVALVLSVTSFFGLFFPSLFN